MEDTGRLQERFKLAQKKNIELMAELELTHRLIARIRAERNLILDRVYKEEMSVVDVGALSDEDEGLSIGHGGDLVDWPEFEAAMVKKKLLSQQQQHHTTSNPSHSQHNRSKHNNNTATIVIPTSSTTASTTTTAPSQSPRKRSLANSDSSSTADKPRRIVKTAEAAAAVPKKVQNVPLDQEGKPILPITCGIVTVHELGQVVTDRPAFHNKRYIWPIGFKSSRQYLSTMDPEASVTYFSEVKESGPGGGPLFEVWSEEAPDQRFQSQTSTGAWSAVFKAAGAVRGKEVTNSASGPDFYGFSNNTIAMMIEMLPGVESCLNYQRKNFEMKPAAAAGKGSKATSQEEDGGAEASSSPDLDLDVGTDQLMQSDLPNQEQVNADLMSLANHALHKNI